MEPDELAIHELHSTWIDAVNAGDSNRLLDLMTDDAVFLSPGQGPLGREGFSPNFLSAHQRLSIRCESVLEEVVVAGEVAYTRCRDALSTTPHAGGDTTRLAGHRLTVYRKNPSGSWLLARDAHTLAPVEQPRS